jgi:hypothetical protein
VDEYETVSKDLKNRIRAAKRSMEKKLAKADARNKKPFYNYIKKKTKSSETVGPLKTPTGEVITDDKEMAEELNNAFSKVFTREDDNVPPAEFHPVRTKLRKSFITTQKVRENKTAEKNKLSRA